METSKPEMTGMRHYALTQRMLSEPVHQLSETLLKHYLYSVSPGKTTVSIGVHQPIFRISCRGRQRNPESPLPDRASAFRAKFSVGRKVRSMQTARAESC